MALVDYASSDSDSDSDSRTAAPPAKRTPAAASTSTSTSTPTSTSRTKSATPAPTPAPKPRRALPRLPDTFSGLSAHDNAAQHQGRVRTRPFVEGDYYAHVYVELDIPPTLRRALNAVVAAARGHVPEGTELHPLFTGTSSSTEDAADDADDDEGTLHVSLTHPLALRRDAAASFPGAVRAALAGPATSTTTAPFRVSLATLAVYHNTAAQTPSPSPSPSPALGAPPSSSATSSSTPAPPAPPPPPRRAFLALRVGAGVPPLRALVQRIAASPAVRFAHDRRSEGVYFADAEFHASFAWWLDHSGGGKGDGDGRGMVRALEAEVGERVRGAQPRGGWEVRAVCVKVAKEVTRVVLG